MKERIVWGLISLGTFLWGFSLGGAFGRAQLMSDALPVPLFLMGALCVLMSPALLQILKKARKAQLGSSQTRPTLLSEVFKAVRLYGRQAPLFENSVVRSEAFVVVRPLEIDLGVARHLIVENWGLGAVRLMLGSQRVLLAPKTIVRLIDTEPGGAALRIESEGLTAQDPELVVHFLRDH